MTTKYVVEVYTLTEEIIVDDEFDAECESDRQQRLYGNICRVRSEEFEDEDDENRYEGD